MIMMVYHHFFAWPERILVPSAYMEYSFHGIQIVYFIAKACKLCVCIFAFLSGYGLFFSYSSRKHNKEKIQYCLKKIIEMLIIYWSVLFAVAFFERMSDKQICLSEFINNVLLLKMTILHTAWYVKFYVQAMIALLIYVVCVHKQAICEEIILMLALPCALYYVMPENMFSHYFPTFMLGYVAAKYDLYEKIDMRIGDIKLTAISLVMLLLLMVVRLKVGDSIGPMTIIFFMSMPLVWIMKIVSNYIQKVIIIRKVLMLINIYSVYYWLLHSVFHSGINEIQKAVYWPYFPVLIVGWAFILMSPFAIVLKKCDDRLLSVVEKRIKAK